MKTFLLLFVCLSLSHFAVARATKPAHTPDPGTKMLLKDTNTNEEVASDDDEGEDDPSGDEGEDLNDDDGSGAVGHEGTGADDGGNDDGADDGDDASDDEE